MTNFAVIKTGGKQYVVKPGEKLKIEKINASEGEKVIFKDVLLVTDGKGVEIGRPFVPNTQVEAKVLRQGRQRKVIVFKYHSKTRYRKKKGHRQPFTEVQIEKIVMTSM